ncbi:hypothetical protein KR093_000751, partial [Drosophila rubida]
LFERMLMPEGVVKNIDKVISRELIFNFNFHGTSNKKPFDKYIHLNQLMYGVYKLW